MKVFVTCVMAVSILTLQLATGCFEQKTTEFHDLNVTSIIGCQYQCFNTSAFAIMDTKCACLGDLSSLGEPVDPALCNITCEGTYCGGKNVTNVYVTVEKEFFKRRMLLRNKTKFTSCVTTQCIDKNLLYTETDCQTDKEIEAACSTFFSCTFEPGDPCFLSQTLEDDFDWTITKNKTTYGPEKAYQGSFFAFVNDSKNSTLQGKKATLHSNVVVLAGGKWCLRFRYHTPDIRKGASLNIIAQSMEGNVIFEKQFLSREFKEWSYTELEIDLREEKKVNILFEFTRGEDTTNFALDDVTLTQGTCERTLTTVLLMTGRLKCDFEGNYDVCFKQDKGDNFDWSITRKGQTKSSGTGPSGNIEGNYFSFIEARGQRRGYKAVLISKFDLKDINITLRLFYNMYGDNIRTLKVYATKENPLFTKKGNQGENWKNTSITTFILGSQKLFVSANVDGKSRGDIAIDDVQIKVNQPSESCDTDKNYPRTWLRSSKECVRKVASYLIPHSQLDSTRCSFYESRERWTGILRPHQKYTTADIKEKGRDPTWVQVYNVSNGALVWEPFNSTMMKSFICVKTNNISSSENDTCITRRHEPDSDPVNPLGGRTKSNRDIIIGTVVVIVVAVLFITVVIVIFKRKLKMKIKHKMNNMAMTNVTYERQNDVIAVKKTYLKNSQNSDEHPDQEDYYVNQMPVESGLADHSTVQPTDGDYDHLHATNSNKTSANDDVYSHMTDDQYGFQEEPEDDTYDHSSFGLVVESEYGAAVVKEDGSNTYDHTSSINAASGAIGDDQDKYQNTMA
ncbi:uncharacterized protein LOC128185900 isoform X4 [Crassostrea angulata]|uniref:uncharacterized protein LOC128185900 isoform X4 n=1 Tax=Magallana angulata TaxID=2784310 RepID=UPI0022B0F2A2|nr:uncharacterized protein LOC128185900 isoform X4 [Crassostrea angulata]